MQNNKPYSDHKIVLLLVRKIVHPSLTKELHFVSVRAWEGRPSTNVIDYKIIPHYIS